MFFVLLLLLTGTSVSQVPLCCFVDCSSENPKAMSTDPDFRSFYQRWVSEFGLHRKSTIPSPDSFWEGPDACKELMSGSDWLLVLVPSTDPADHPFTSLRANISETGLV